MRKIIVLTTALAMLAGAASAFPGGHNSGPPSGFGDRTTTVDSSRTVGPAVIDRSVTTTRAPNGKLISTQITRTVTRGNNVKTTTETCGFETGSHIKVCN